MKPFDLEKAKNGEPVCTAKGSPAKILDFYFNGSILAKVRISDETETEILIRYKNDGTPIEPSNDPDFRLTMPTKILYMKLYKSSTNGLIYGSQLCSTMETCRESSSTLYKTFFRYAKVELMEDEE